MASDVKGLQLAALGFVVGFISACGVNSSAPPEVERRTSALLSAASLQLEALTNSCGANQAQDFFEVINNGGSGVKLSDITIKYWIDDTSGTAVVPHVWTGGCLTNASGCFHQVSGVTATATSFAPACGPDANHQANWEISVTNTDSTPLGPGVSWTNIQTAINLANYSNFSPGTAKWFSPCLTGSGYAADSHFAVYSQGNLVFSSTSGLDTPSCRSPHGQVQLQGHITPAMATAPLLGPVPPNTTISMAIGLPLRNQSALAAEVQAVSDPANPAYGQYLTIAQFTSAFGPLQTDYNNLKAFAQANGLSISKSYPNRLILSVTGTAAAVERVFYVNLNHYSRPDGSTFYGPDREPSYDSSVAIPITFISGLSDFLAEKTPAASISQSGGNGSGLGGNYLAQDIRNAYTSCTSLDGTGQGIGLLVGAGFNMSDINAYYAANGSLFTNVLTPIVTPADFTVQTGVVFDPSTCDSKGANCRSIHGSIETAGDIEMASAMAPGAQVHVYIYGSNAVASLNDMVNDLPTVKQFSTSFQFAVQETNVANTLQEMQVQGQTFFLPSGDNGAYPTDNFNGPIGLALNLGGFTVVGATTLKMNGKGASYESETTWNSGGLASGGGFVPNGFAPIPSFQSQFLTATAQNEISTQFRNDPDVAMVGDQVEVFLTCGQVPNCLTLPASGHSPVTQVSATASGTSLSSPLWAGFMALVNEKRAKDGLATLGPANPVLYALGASPLYQANFNDIADGSNNNAPNFDLLTGMPLETPTYKAVAGYDLTTGWGTPRCGLINQLSTSSPTGPINVAVSAGGFHTCALKNNGTVFCWGDNDNGEVGDGTTTQRPAPTQVAGLSGVTAISAGFFHTCALKNDGTVWCWGSNAAGNLGTGTTTDSPLPVQVQSLPAAIAVSAGDGFSCAVLTTGQVMCWGDNRSGELGEGLVIDQEPLPVMVRQLNNAIAVGAGEEFACALLANGTAECWGENVDGNLGTGDTNNAFSPVSVQNLSSVSQIAVDGNYACALKTNGTMSCWGSNGGGDFGNGTTNGSDLPIPITSITGATTIAVGAATCAILVDGTLECWGNNGSGQVGNGTTVQQVFPVTVPGLAGALAVAAGQFQVCALLSANQSVWCWGGNAHGEVGNGTTTDQHAPVMLQF